MHFLARFNKSLILYLNKSDLEDATLTLIQQLYMKLTLVLI